jgi:hypothetical protein
LKLTTTIIATNDVTRRMLHGASARLYLVEHHATDGYALGPRVARGWNLESAEDGKLALEVPELPAITPAMLRKAAGFAIRSNAIVKSKGLGDGLYLVLKIAARREPEGEISRVWTFEVSYTSETLEV